MKRVLLVDDNAAFAENTGEILRDLGFDVTIADAGNVALEQVRTARFDALVTDMRMPGMDGGQLLQAIRQLDPGLPAIVLTAFSSDASLAVARREGVYAILPKPIDVRRMISHLERARRDAIVALVDDDAALTDALTEILREAGYTVVSAVNLVELESLCGVRPGCAIVDWRLPGGANGEALRRIRAGCPDIPVVLITGHELEAPVGGVQALFHKPFRTADLLREVDQAMHRRGAA